MKKKTETRESHEDKAAKKARYHRLRAMKELILTKKSIEDNKMRERLDQRRNAFLINEQARLDKESDVKGYTL